MKIFKLRKTRLHVFFASLCNASKNVIKHFVGNKAKGRISKWRLEESKARQARKKCSFSEYLASFAFLLPPFWDSLFCLITDDLLRHYTVVSKKITPGFFIYVGTGISKSEIIFVSAYRGVFITQLNMYDDSFCFHPLTYFAEKLHRRFSTGFYIHLWLTHIW